MPDLRARTILPNESLEQSLLRPASFLLSLCPIIIDPERAPEGTEPFDFMIFGNELPGRRGVELIRHGRNLALRKRVPFVMFSASDVELQAWGTGADAFLRKPEDVGKLAATVTRLLSEGAG